MRRNIILAHGYLGFRHVGPFEYFNGVKRHLEDNYPVTVVETKVNPVKGVELRGKQLRRQVLIALGEVEPETREERAIAGRLDPEEPVHLISHSMGGLDCRYLLSPANPENLGGRVATLSTVGGPHRGSPTADFLIKRLAGQTGSRFERELADGLLKMLEALGFSLEGLEDLTTEWTAGFNDTYDDHPSVRYFSVGGGGRDGEFPTAMVMMPSWKYVKDQTGEVNDGVVPQSSARWGKFNPDLWPADHPGLIGHDANNPFGSAPPGFDYLARYGALVEQLFES